MIDWLGGRKMNEWMSNEKWRKKVNNVYIMRNHNFAFLCMGD